MKLHELKVPEGSKHSQKRLAEELIRLGRNSGKGEKGQNSDPAAA